ncbi:MAG: HIT domain-containing protein [Bacilli bacterium]|nr:HIT domain-containing protein [Bacilli bacterium]
MDCIFCKIIKGDIPSYTIYENDYVKCFLDVNPISNGHTLIIPKTHFKDINDIDEKYLLEINKAAKIVVKLLDEKLSPNGYKLQQNNGNLQEVKHYHLHVVPSYIANQEKDNVSNIYDKIIK